jgi:hypothetical protein
MTFWSKLLTGLKFWFSEQFAIGIKLEYWKFARKKVM